MPGQNPDDPSAGKKDLDAGKMLPDVYEELRGLAEACFRGQSNDHTLQPTALVHEVYLKLAEKDASTWSDRTHFFAVAARAMRQVLIDHARIKGAAKRGKGWQRITLDMHEDAPGLGRLDVLALDEALDKLAEIDDRQARIVEMRFFAGLTVNEVAEAIGVSSRTVELDWQMAKAWLSRALARAEEDAED